MGGDGISGWNPDLRRMGRVDVGCGLWLEESDACDDPVVAMAQYAPLHSQLLRPLNIIVTQEWRAPAHAIEYYYQILFNLYFPHKETANIHTLQWDDARSAPV